MAIAYGAAGTQLDLATSTTSAPVAYPAGITANQALVFVTACNGVAAITPPTGWTTIFDTASGASTDPRIYAAVKIATGSETGTVTFTSASSVRWSAQMHRFTGVHTATPADGSFTTVDSSTTSTTTAVIPSVTASIAGCVPLYGAAQQSTSRTFTGPSGSNEITDTSLGNGGTAARSGAFYYDAPVSASGATGTRTVTASSAGVATIGAMVLLRPASTGQTKTLAGSLTSVGVIPPRTVTKRAVGASTGSGAAFRRFSPKVFTGSVTGVGAKVARLGRAFAGSVSGTGYAQRSYPRTYAGLITASGVKKHLTQKRPSGTVAPAGGIGRKFSARFNGFVSAVGVLATGVFHRVFGRSGSAVLTVSSAADADLTIYLRHRAALEVYTIADALFAGQDIRSATGAPVRPVTTPQAPSGVVAVPGNMRATVSFVASPDDGGSPITGYTVYSSTGASATDSTSPIVVTGLANGTAVTFIVTASNIAGESVPSDASAPVSPVAGAPAAPSGVVLTPGNGSVSVAWTTPASTGGSPITGYTVNLSTGATVTGSNTPVAVSGLANGVPVTATVSAANAIGSSAPSDRSDPATPRTVPGAPTIGTPSASAGQVAVTWTTPSTNGGAPITGYTITTYAGSTSTIVKTTTVGVVTSATVTGLANSSSYSFTVTATNAAGSGAASARSTTVTPLSAAITTRTATTSLQSTATKSLQLTKPTGTAAGDVLVATFTTDNVDMQTAPTGWVLVGASRDTSPYVFAYYRVVVAGDASVGSWTWTLQSTSTYGGGMQAYAGVNLSNVLDGTPVTNRTSSSTDTVSASCATTSVGTLVAAIGASSSTISETPPTGWTEDFDIAGAGALCASQAHISYAAAGTGTYAWKSSLPRAQGLVIFALRRA